MRRKSISFIAFILILLSFASICTVSAAPYEETDQIPYDSYTYWQYSSSEKEAVYNKPIYKIEKVVDYQSMGLDEQLGKITDIATSNNGDLFILDGAKSKIIILDKYYNSKAIIDTVFKDETKINFKDANGIFVDSENLIYIADTNNSRVIVCDENGVWCKEYLLPDSRLIPDDFNFKPIKVTRDSRGYTYILSDGSYNGAILYSPQDEFLGFYGANKVRSSVTQIITTLWNKIIMTDEKRAASSTTLPFQFTDICIDKKDFVYTATGNTSKDMTQKGQIRKLSPGGKDVLDSNNFNYADEGVGSYTQDLHGVIVDSDGFIYALDSSYGHIFVYDQENNILGVFGTGAKIGTQDGSFSTASAIEINGKDVIVADSTLNTISIFSETEYGILLKQAQILTNGGDYIKAKSLWSDLLSQDKQNQLIYKGLAKAYYEEENYTKALEYSKIAYDRDTYAIAFKEVRNGWITKYFSLIIFIIVLLIVALILGFKYKKKKEKHFLSDNIRLMLSVWSHPGDSFEKIKLNGKGSVILATIIALMFYLTDVLTSTMGGFCFTYFNTDEFNAAITLLRTSGLILLFVICFWAISTLMQGQGKVKEIYIVVTYSMQPMILGNFLYIILTNVMIPSEIGFLGIMSTILTLYSIFLAIRGLMKINDYEFGRLVVVTLLTFVAMLIVLFVGIVIFLLMQLLVGFIKTMYTEIYKIITFGG